MHSASPSVEDRHDITMYYWKNNRKEWVPYGEAVSAMLEEARSKGASKARLRIGQHDYHIDFGTRRQERVDDPLHHWRHVTWKRVEVVRHVPRPSAPPASEVFDQLYPMRHEE